MNKKQLKEIIKSVSKLEKEIFLDYNNIMEGKDKEDQYNYYFIPFKFGYAGITPEKFAELAELIYKYGRFGIYDNYYIYTRQGKTGLEIAYEMETRGETN